MPNALSHSLSYRRQGLSRNELGNCSFKRAAIAAVLTLALASVAHAAEPKTPQAPSQSSSTGTKFKADADMQQVLDALAALGGKPIESLDAVAARKQPTPADAAMVVAKRRGLPTDPAKAVPGVSSVDREIPGPVSQLPVRVYTPTGAGPFPLVVYFHGGGWVIADKEAVVEDAADAQKYAGQRMRGWFDQH